MSCYSARKVSTWPCQGLVLLVPISFGTPNKYIGAASLCFKITFCLGNNKNYFHWIRCLDGRCERAACWHAGENQSMCTFVLRSAKCEYSRLPYPYGVYISFYVHIAGGKSTFLPSDMQSKSNWNCYLHASSALACARAKQQHLAKRVAGSSLCEWRCSQEVGT